MLILLEYKLENIHFFFLTRILKGIVHPKINILSFTHHHVISNHIKNVDDQTILVPFDFHCMDKKYNVSQWEPKPFDYQHSSKYCIFEFSRRKMHTGLK